MPGGGHVQGVGMSGEGISREMGIPGLMIYIYTPLVLTPSGSHQNIYGWKAGGTHPTGMLSCCCFFWYRELLTEQVEASFITNQYFTAVDRVRRVQLRRQVFVTRVVTVMDLLSSRAFQERTTRSMDLTPLKIVFLVHQVEVVIMTQSCFVLISLFPYLSFL